MQLVLVDAERESPCRQRSWAGRPAPSALWSQSTGGITPILKPGSSPRNWPRMSPKVSPPRSEIRLYFRGTWVAQSVKGLTLDFSSGHDLMVREFEPRVGLHTDGAEPACDSLSLLLSLPHPRSCSLTVKINKYTFKEKKK